MSAGLLQPLVCPRCSGPLGGGPRALVFLCPQCAVATHASDLKKAYPLRYAAPVLYRAAPDLFAPFWRVEGDFSWSTRDTQKRRVYGNQRPLGALFFPAFWSPKVAYCDNLTLRYAQEGVQMRLEVGSAQVLDGLRDPQVLGELARLAWLAYMDRVADVTGVEGRFEVREITYAALPFYKDTGRYLDGILGVPVPEAYFA